MQMQFKKDIKPQNYEYIKTRSSLWKIILQHLISSLSVNSCTVCRHTVQLFRDSDDTRCCDNTIVPAEDEHCNARNMSRTIM